MTIHATGTFETTNWNEKPASANADQPKLTRVELGYAYHGDFEGAGKAEYLMYSSSNNIAYFLGYEQVTGRLGGRSGSFVLQHTGTYDGGENLLELTLSVVPGSATDELSGLLGQGGGKAYHGQPDPATFTFDYDIM